jgi:hypothetical protein
VTIKWQIRILKISRGCKFYIQCCGYGSGSGRISIILPDPDPGPADLDPYPHLTLGRIWFRIKMESQIRIGINTMQIHNTGYFNTRDGIFKLIRSPIIDSTRL